VPIGLGRSWSPMPPIEGNRLVATTNALAAPSESSPRTAPWRPNRVRCSHLKPCQPHRTATGVLVPAGLPNWYPFCVQTTLYGDSRGVQEVDASNSQMA
jgi:hypothetical protein